MVKDDLKQFDLPDSPGVYIFKKGDEILYVGKATSLRDRVRSYFAPDVIATRGLLIVDMVFRAETLEHRVTDSVLEALILEAHLIKKHQPYCNTKEKDDKSYTYVVITNEDFPKVITVRGRELEQLYPHEDRKYTFGPFPHGQQLREAMKLIRRIFPYRDKCVPWAEIPESKRAQARACFNHQIGLCSGVCIGNVSKQEYGRMIQNLRLFFEGKKAALIKNLEKEMKAYAKTREFEKAEKVKQQIYALNHIQDVSLIKRDKTEAEISGRDTGTAEFVFRIEAYDIAHMSGGSTVGAMVVVEDGEAQTSGYRKFKIRTFSGANDIAGLKEILRRRLKHQEWQLPNLIAVDGNAVHLKAAQDILDQFDLQIPVVAVTKDEAHKARAILGDEEIIKIHSRSIVLANSEAHRFAIGYHRKVRKTLFRP